jgi:hypothetical protein
VAPDISEAQGRAIVDDCVTISEMRENTVRMSEHAGDL